MGKVVMTKDSRIEKNFPAEWASNVQVELTNGKKYEKFVRFPKGDPENPLTWEELSAKFGSLAMRVLARDRCEEITKLVSEIQPSSDLRQIWKLAALSAPAAGKSN
jgi:2-methylcitrate dehydratase PrpD